MTIGAVFMSQPRVLTAKELEYVTLFAWREGYFEIAQV